MKKVLLPLSILALTFAACSKKETVTNSAIVAISSDETTDTDAMLSFETLAEYEAFFIDESVRVDKLDATLYTPLYTVTDQLELLKADTTEAAYTMFYDSPNLSDTLYFDSGLLLTILNQNKMVGLGDYYVKVDATTETVYAIEKTEPDALNIIKNEALTSDAVLKLPFEADAALILFNIGCADPTAGTNSAGTRVISGKKATDYYGAYQTFGIYHSLMAKVHNEKKYLWNWWDDKNGSGSIRYVNYYYQVRCGRTENYSGNPLPSHTDTRWVHIINRNIVKCRVYEGATRLANYFYEWHTTGVGGYLTWSISG